MAVNVETNENSVKATQAVSVTASSKVASSEAQKASSHDSSDLEMKQMLSSLSEAIDVKDVKEKSPLSSVGILNEETVANHVNSTMQNLSEKFNQAVEKMASNPAYYMADFCEGGKLSEEKVISFCQKEVEGINQRVEELKAQYTQKTAPAETSSPAPKTSSSSDSDNPFSSTHYSSSYFATAAVMGELATNVGFIEGQIATESALQSEWGLESTNEFSKLATDSMNDVIKQCDKIASLKKHRSPLEKAFKITGYCSIALGSVVMAFGGSPGLAAGIGSIGIMSATGGFSEIEKLVAVVLKDFGVPDHIAKLVADIIIVTLVVAAAVAATILTGGTASFAMVALVTSMVLPMTDTFSDLGTVIVDANGGKGEEKIMMSVELTGMVLCLLVSLVSGYFLFKCAGVVAEAAEVGSETAAIEGESMFATMTRRLTAASKAVSDQFIWAGEKIASTLGTTRTTMMRFMLGLDFVTNATTAVLEGLLAENQVDITNDTKDLSYAEADLNLYDTIKEQVSANVESMTSSNSDQISELGSSLSDTLRALSKPYQAVADILA